MRSAFARLAVFVDEISKGAKPVDAIEQSAKFEGETRTWGLGKDAPLRPAVHDLLSSPHQSCTVCIIATPGYDFRE